MPEKSVEGNTQTDTTPRSEGPPTTDNSSPESEEQLVADASPAPVENDKEAGTNGAVDDSENLVKTDLEEGVAVEPVTDNSSQKLKGQVPAEETPTPVKNQTEAGTNGAGDDSENLVKTDLEEGVAVEPVTDNSSQKLKGQVPAEEQPVPVNEKSKSETSIDANKDNEDNGEESLETDLEKGVAVSVLASTNSTVPGAFAVNNPLFDEQRAEALRSSLEDESNLESGDPSLDSPLDPSSNENIYSINSSNPSECPPPGLPVANKSTVVVAQPMESPEIIPSEPTNKNRKDRRTKTFVAVVLSLILVVAILIYLNLSKRKETELGEEPSSLEEAGSDDFDPGDNLLKERYSAMIDILAPLSGGPEVFDPKHPSASRDRISALQWIVEEDTAQLQIPQSAITTSASAEIGEGTISADNDYEDALFQLRQRYVLALFYYATNGDNWWEKFQFLSGFDVCRWSTAWAENYGTWLFRPIGIKGAVCDQDNRVSALTMYWNNLSGTIPDEISLFSETMTELNIGGGTLSGTIPSSLGNFTKLYSLSLSDHCLTGSIPEGIDENPPLTILSMYGNSNQLTGTLGDKFCSSPNSTDLREGGVLFATDSNNACSCCTTCDPSDFSCYEVSTQNTWTTNNMGDLNALKSQFEKSCATPEQREWIMDECPCVINVSWDLETFPFFGACDTNCTDPEPDYIFDGSNEKGDD